MIDFEALNSQLLQSARELLPEWIPGGRWRGREYVAGSIQGGAGESFSVNAETGQFADFAGGPKGGDFVALYASIHGFNQREAALALGAVDKPNGSGNGAHHPPARSAKSATSPAATQLPPEEAWAAQDFKHSRYGLPAAFWLYRNAASAVLYAVARYDQPDGKQIVPWTWHDRWLPRSHPKPRPLYGLDRLATINGPALIVEGEKTADAAQAWFPHNPCITWSGGANAVRTADWTAVAGRACILWPDNDEPGMKAMATLATHLFSLGCTLQIITNEHRAEGWDLADATAEDDVETYAESHIRDIPRPQAVVKTPKPRAEVVAEPSPAAAPVDSIGSLDALYAQHDFMTKSGGAAYCNEHNVGCTIRYKNLDIYYDEYSQRIKCGDAEWGDRQNFELMAYMQRNLKMPDINPKTVRDGVAMYAFTRPRNPPKEWLKSLTWDGERRLAQLLVDGFGCPPNDYYESVGRCFMVGMVARVLRPGCQVDCMPVFEGGQGGFKTSALRIIGGEYFAEIHDSIMSKDFAISLAGKMLCEISELGAFKTAEIERIKAIITTTVDRYRAPYGVTSMDHPRQGVFSGTTNRDDWNTDETGARRFWPVSCGDIDRAWIAENREQLFAEAVNRFSAGEQWWDVPEVHANRERNLRREDDPWEGFLDAYLNANSHVRINHLLTLQLDVPVERIDQKMQRRISKILKRRGYRNTQRRDGEENVREWIRKT